MGSNDSKFVMRYKCSLTHRWRFLDFANGREVSNPLDISMYLTAEQVAKVMPIAREKARLAAGASSQGVQNAIDNIEAVSLDRALSELSSF